MSTATTTGTGARLKSDLEVLEDALILIETGCGWSQGAYCRDAGGYEVQPVIGTPDEWVRVSTDYVGAGGYRARTAPTAKPCSFCLEGAVRTAAGYWSFNQAHPVHEQVHRLEGLLLRLATSAAIPWWPSLHAFNDDPRTTKCDVALLLKHAIAHLGSEEQL